MKKLIIGNILVILLFLLILNIISYSAIAIKNSTQIKQKIEMLPNYPNEKEFLEYLEDKHNLSITYKAYEGWTHQPYQGKYMSINDQGYRTTINPYQAAKKECWMLGGSTMWGYGNRDSTTIPSLFAAANDSFMVYNYAEQGFNTRQGLARLVNLQSLGKRADLVISLDGVNDIISLCYEDTSIPGHSRSKVIKKRLVNTERQGFPKIILFHLKEVFIQVFLSNTLQLSSKVHNKVFGKKEKFDKIFTCLGDEDRIERIANQFIRNWEIMHHLVEEQGGEFIAILQPAVGISQARTDHIEHRLIQNRLEHFKAFYPILQKKIKQLNYDWIYDYTSVFDNHTKEYIFIDNCHVSANGNRMIVDALINHRK